MKKSVSTLLLLLVLAPVGAIIVEGCQEDDPCRVGSAPKFFDIQGLTFVAVRLAGGSAVAANEAVAATEIRLEIQPQVAYYGRQPARRSWFPAAYACTPTPIAGYGGTDEELDSLVVRAAYAYDATHPAGTSLNDLLINEHTGQLLALAPARGTQPQLYASPLRLRQAPAQPGPQQFVLRYRLTNGETYTARTPVFTLR